MTSTGRSQGILDDITRWEQGRSMSSSSARLGADGLPNPTANGDCDRIVEPGQTVVIADLKGPGVITHVWMTVYHFQSLQFGAEPGGRANPQEVLIRMYWDGREKPDVEAPMSDFFAAGFGRRTTVLSLPVVTEDGDSYNCWWRMPFRESARIEVINQSTKNLRALFYSVDWIQKESLPANTMYFCAQYRQEYPVQGNPDRVDNEYLILDAEGKGYYVGTLLSVRTRSPDWFGEGDIRMTIDGKATPSVWGTGTEDYFLSAWGQKPCLTPYFGTAYLSHKNRDVGQMSSCYRWHIPDPIVFNKSLRVAIETMGWANRDENPEGQSRMYCQRQDDVSSIAYWYQLGAVKRFAETTTAEQRKLPSIDPIIAWGKDHQAGQHHGKGRTRMRNTDTYFDTDPVLEFTPESRDDAWIELAFEVQRKQPFRLIVVLGRSPHCGIYQASLDGVKISTPMDLYSDTDDGDDYQLMDFWPEPGKYVLRLECVGRNHLSDGDQIRINSVRLRERRPRVERIGYLKDHDWRANPILIDKNTPPLKSEQK
ncbi:MAG: DUF2961 domain-containing protein [Phycisphaerae bacterium]|nr:DUF2961 domain-containing protein [Phycisphaerae bacterium]